VDSDNANLLMENANLLIMRVLTRIAMDVTYGDRTENPTGSGDTEMNYKGGKGEEDADVEDKEDEKMPSNVKKAEEKSEEVLKHLVIS
jgi:hypothetical protein